MAPGELIILGKALNVVHFYFGSLLRKIRQVRYALFRYGELDTAVCTTVHWCGDLEVVNDDSMSVFILF